MAVNYHGVSTREFEQRSGRLFLYVFLSLAIMPRVDHIEEAYLIDRHNPVSTFLKSFLTLHGKQVPFPNDNLDNVRLLDNVESIGKLKSLKLIDISNNPGFNGDEECKKLEKVNYPALKEGVFSAKMLKTIKLIV